MDEVKAQMLADYTTLPELHVLHHRPTARTTNMGRGVQERKGELHLGYHPLFMLLKCAKR